MFFFEYFRKIIKMVVPTWTSSRISPPPPCAGRSRPRARAPPAARPAPWRAAWRGTRAAPRWRPRPRRGRLTSLPGPSARSAAASPSCSQPRPGQGGQHQQLDTNVYLLVVTLTGGTNFCSTDLSTFQFSSRGMLSTKYKPPRMRSWSWHDRKGDSRKCVAHAQH